MNIKIYGERNTGTNYLVELLRLNLNVNVIPGIVPPSIRKLQRFVPGEEIIRDLYFKLTYSQNLGWKHMLVKSAPEIKKTKLGSANTCFITLTKNPYSWLLSLYKRPYHQYYTDKPSLEEFLSKPWKTVDRDALKSVENPIGLWNLKNASYFNLTNEFQTIHLRYEDLLKDPIATISDIIDKFSLTQKQPILVNSFLSTKEKNKDFVFYQNYYLNEIWKTKLSDEAINIINKSLDYDLVRKYKYSIL